MLRSPKTILNNDSDTNNDILGHFKINLKKECIFMLHINLGAVYIILPPVKITVLSLLVFLLRMTFFLSNF